MSERTFRRWTRRYEEEGEAGLVDRRLGKASGKRVPADRAEEVEALYRERYQGFTVKHFHEHLVKDHGFGWRYTWTKLHLQWMGIVAKARRKGAHRRKRERRPQPGMMLHQDGSRHAWLEGRAPLKSKSNRRDRRRYASAGQLAPIAEAPAPHRLRQLSASTNLMPAGRTVSVEKKKTDPECGSGAPGTKIETRPSFSASV